MMTKLGFEPKAIIYATAMLVLPQLVAAADDDEPDAIGDLVATAVDFGFALIGEVETRLDPLDDDGQVEKTG